MAPSFDEFVTNVEQRVLPQCEALAAELRDTWPGFEYKTFSHRHVDVVNSLGLWCGAPGYTPGVEDDSRGILINLFGITGLSARAFVVWNRWHRVGRTMFSMKEVAGRPFGPSSASDLNEFFEELPILYDALRQTFQRGHPPDLRGLEWNEDAGRWQPSPKRSLLRRLIWWKA